MEKMAPFNVKRCCHSFRSICCAYDRFFSTRFWMTHLRKSYSWPKCMLVEGGWCGYVARCYYSVFLVFEYWEVLIINVLLLVGKGHRSFRVRYVLTVTRTRWWSESRQLRTPCQPWEIIITNSNRCQRYVCPFSTYSVVRRYGVWLQGDVIHHA